MLLVCYFDVVVVVAVDVTAVVLVMKLKKHSKKHFVFRFSGKMSKMTNIASSLCQSIENFFWSKKVRKKRERDGNK